MVNRSVLVPFLHCYGHWDWENRHPVAMAGYERYIAEFDSFMESLIRGGYTVPLTSYLVGGALHPVTNQAEAETLQEELMGRGNQLWIRKTTWKLLGGQTHAACLDAIVAIISACFDDEKFDYCPIYFVDEVRRERVIVEMTRALVAAGLGKSCNALEMVVGLPRIDIDPNSTPAMQALALQKAMAGLLDELKG